MAITSRDESLRPGTRCPQKNKIYIRHIQLLATKIYFGIIEIYDKNMLKYILSNISHFCKENVCKIYFNYNTFGENIFYTS